MTVRRNSSLASVIFLGVIVMTPAAWADTAQPVLVAQLLPKAQVQFLKYRKIPQARVYRAFALELESGTWGQSTSPSWPRIAVKQAIEDCRQRAARGCEIYAVGNIVIHRLADWQVQVATLLYQVKRNATNDDLEAICTKTGAASTLALRKSVLYAGARMGSTGAIGAMLERGVGVDARSDAGATALMYAASRGHHHAVALLLKRGANVDARNSVGKTALSLAFLAKSFAEQRNYRSEDHDAVIRLLKDAGGTE